MEKIIVKKLEFPFIQRCFVPSLINSEEESLLYRYNVLKYIKMVYIYEVKNC